MALNFPDAPSNGQKFIATNGVEYTYNAANDSWTGALEAGAAPIDPQPDDVSATPQFGDPSGTNPGAGTESDPYIITTSTVLLAGETAKSEQYITVTDGKPGDQVLFTNNTTPVDIAPKYNQAVGTIDANGSWSGYLTYDDAAGAATTSDTTYTGKLQLGTSSVYFQWQVQQGAATPLVIGTQSVLTATTQPTIIPPGNTLSASNPVVTGGVTPYTYTYQWEESVDGTNFTEISGATSQTLDLTPDNADAGDEIRCVVTVSDASSFSTQTVDSTTEAINVVDVIVILTETEPKVGEDITANGIVAGNKSSYIPFIFQWYRNDTDNPILGATSPTYTPVSGDIGDTLACQVTAVGDGPNVSGTSLFTAAVEPAESVNEPTLLTPPNGAGFGPSTIIPTTDSLQSVTNAADQPITTIVASGDKDIEYLQEGTATMTDASGTVATYTPTSNIITNVNSGGIQGADPAGLTVYYGVLTADCQNLDGSDTAKTFAVPSDPTKAFNGNTAGTDRAQANQPNGIDLIFPDGIGDSTTGASIYTTTATGVMIAVNGDFANGRDQDLLPESKGFFDLSNTPAFQRDGKLYRVTVYNSEGTNGVIGVTAVAGSADGQSNVFTASSYGTATGFTVPGQATVLTFSNNQDLTYFNVGDVVQGGPAVEGLVTLDNFYQWVGLGINDIANTENWGFKSALNYNYGGSNYPGITDAYVEFILPYTVTATELVVYSYAPDKDYPSVTTVQLGDSGSSVGASSTVLGTGSVAYLKNIFNNVTFDRIRAEVQGGGYAGKFGAIYGVWIDGVALQLPAIEPAVNPIPNGTTLTAFSDVGYKITDIDIDNDQMTTSGGNWYGTDGSQSGDAYAGANQSQVWTDNSGNDWVAYNNESQYGLLSAFDGNLETNAQSTQSAATIAFSGLTTGYVSLITSAASFQRDDIYYTLNGTRLTEDNTSQSNITINGVSSTVFTYDTQVAPTQIQQINTTSSSLSLYGIMYNGQILVNTGLPAILATGDNQVTAPAITGTGRIFSVGVNTDTVTVIESNGNWVSSGVWNPVTGQGNAAGTSFYLTGDEISGITVDPDDVHMTCTPFSGQDAVYGSSTWQVTTDDDPLFFTPVVNVTNTNDTFYNISTITPETSPVIGVTGSGTSGSPYVLTLSDDKQLTYFDEGESVTSIGSSGGGSFYGLRFDSARETYLQTTPDGGISEFTYSVWCKPTGTNVFRLLSVSSSDASEYTILQYRGDNKTIEVASNSGTVSSTKSFPLNEWANFVFVFDGTNVTIYVNDDQAAQGTVDFSAFTDGGSPLTIGAWEQNSPDYSNGYLSEAFFVQGQQLQPSVFGETNSDTQTWVPKSSTAVKAAIEAAFDAEFPSATYNTNENWSNKVTLGTNNVISDGGGVDHPVTNAFNGDSSNACIVEKGTASNSVSFTLATTIENVTSIKVTCGSVDNFQINGGSNIAATGDGENTVYSGSAITLSSLQIIRTSGVSAGGSDTGLTVKSIEVNGKELIDGPSSGFGANGFYLPFDPAATGANYSQNISGTVFSSGYSKVNAFNGIAAPTGWLPAAGTTGIWTANLPVTTSLRLYLTVDNPQTDNSSITVRLNGSDVSVDVVNGSTGWYDVPVTSGSTLNSITIVNGNSGDNYVDLCAVEIDGALLVDHNSIGVDDSGNNNDFYDQNFAVGNTSKMWSITGTFTGNDIDGANNPATVFDGNPNTGINTVPSTGASDRTLKYTFGTPIAITNKTITVNGWNTLQGLVVYIDGVAQTEIQGTSGTSFITTPAYTGNLTAIEATNGSDTNSRGAGMRQIFIGGDQLINLNIQDTVSDTPAKDFAILSPGSNGGLTTTSTTQTGYSTLSRNSASKYYAEFSIVGSGGASSNYSLGVCNQAATEFYSVDGSGGTYIGSAAGSNAGFTFGPNDLMAMAWDGNTLHYYKNGAFVYSLQNDGIDNDIKLFTIGMNANSAAQIYTNFGQQPFAGSNVTYNQDTGIVTLANTYNTSQEWSDTTSTPVSGTASNIFDGDVNTVAEFDGANKVTLTNAPVTASAISIYQNGLDQGTFTLTINGNKTYTNVQQSSSAGWYTYNLGESLNITSIEYDWSVSGGYIITAMMADGQLLIDSNLYNTSQNWVDTSTFTNVDGSPDAIFDGDLDTGAFNDAPDAASITFGTPIASTSSVELYVNPGSSPSYISINGGTTTDITGGSAGWYTAASGTNTVTSIQWQDDQGMKLRAIKIDGKILVDPGGGTFNTLREMESSTTVTGTVVVANPTAKTLSLTSSDNWSGTTGHTVEGEPGTGLSDDTIYRGRVRHTSSNGIESDFSDVNRFKTSGAAPEPPVTGDPDGLRFYPAKTPSLQTTLPDADGTTNFTISAWVKMTGDSGKYAIFSESQSGKYCSFYINNNQLQLEQSGTTQTYNMRSNETVPLNEWANVFVAFDSTPANESFRVQMAINGEFCTYEAFGPPSQNEFAFGEFDGFAQIGTQVSTGYNFDGYMADLYYISSRTLAVDGFAKSINNGTWVPKDAAAAKAYIEEAWEQAYPPATYNTSQVWSANVTAASAYNAGDGPAEAFDGSTSSQMSTSGTASTDWIQITFDPALTNVNQFEVYTSAEVSVAINATSGDQNALPTGSVNTTANDWTNIGHNALTPITSLRIMGPSGGGNTSPRLSAIKVNDKVLVDGPSSGFGANGFYMPFSGESTGMNYSENLTCPGGFSAGNSAANAFDGNIATYAQSAVKPDTFTFTPTTPIAFTSSLRVHTQYAGNLILNGGTPVTVPGQIQWTDVASGAGTLTTLTGTADVDNNVVWDAIEVDGAIIVNHNSIGVDDSGNNNDFYDQNFAVGNTAQTWSQVLTSDNAWTYAPLSDAFNGNATSGANATGGTNQAERTIINWATYFPNGSGPYEVKVYSTPSMTTSLNGATGVVGANGTWTDLGSVDQIDSLEINSLSGGAYLAGVMVNGVELIDANIQDTVLDTPLTDYALLDPNRTDLGGNGGVLVNGNLSYTTENNAGQFPSSYTSFPMSSGKYYWETVMTNAGNPMFGIGNANANVENYVGYDTNSWGYNSLNGNSVHNSTNTSYGDTWGQEDVIGTVFDADAGKITWYVNGVSQGVAYSDIPTGVDYFAGVSKGTSAGMNATVNFGQQPFAYATNNMNGTATIDGELCQLMVDPITEQVGSGTLYYDENQGKAIRSLELANKYGLLARVDKKRGICELTEQPTYPVSHFVKVGDKYRPVRDFSSLALNLFDVIKAAVTTWGAGTVYADNQLVKNGTSYYQANTAHTASSTFAADSTKWDVVDLTHGSFTRALNAQGYVDNTTTISDNRY